MNAFTLLAVAAGASAGAVLAAVLVRPPARLAARVRPYTVAARARLGLELDRGPERLPPSAPAVGGPAVLGRLFDPARVAAVAALGRLLDRRDDDALARALRQAGVPLSVSAYRGRVALQTLGGAAVGAAIGIAVHSTALTLGLLACGLLVGATRSRGRLDRAVQARRERIRLELPTVNQLLAMHIRSGAGPIQATRRLVDRGHGAVVDELHEMLALVRGGTPEPAAFRRAAELTPEPAAARTYKLFAVAAERGVDLADGLRALGEDLRDARREELRRAATRRRAAMLVPTIAVLAPVMLLFIAAPLPFVVFGGR